MNEFKVGELLTKDEVMDIWQLKSYTSLTKLQGTHTSTGADVYIMIVNKNSLDCVLDLNRFSRLAPLVKDVNHPNILKYYKVVQNENQLGIILEHPKGSCLRDFLLNRRTDKKLTENEAKPLLRQIITALEYLHETHQIVHKNINLRNMFVDERGHVKLGDFLICAKLGPIYKSSSAISYHFYAPEIWLDDSKVGPPSDVWSLGILMFVMTCGYYPFDGKQEFDIFLSVKRGRFAIPNNISDECASLIKMILKTHPGERPTLTEVKNHPWFQFIPLLSHSSLRMPRLPTILEADEPTTPPGAYGSSDGEDKSPMSPATQAQFEKMIITDSEEDRAAERRAAVFSEIKFEPKSGFKNKKRLRINNDPLVDFFHYLAQKSTSNMGSTPNGGDENPKLVRPPLYQQSLSEGNLFSSLEPPPPRLNKARRRSDSVLHSEQVMRLLGLDGFDASLSSSTTPSNTKVHKKTSSPPASPLRRPRSKSRGSAPPTPTMSQFNNIFNLFPLDNSTTAATSSDVSTDNMFAPKAIPMQTSQIPLTTRTSPSVPAYIVHSMDQHRMPKLTSEVPQLKPHYIELPNPHEMEVSSIVMPTTPSLQQDHLGSPNHPIPVHPQHNTMTTITQQTTENVQLSPQMVHTDPETQPFANNNDSVDFELLRELEKQDFESIASLLESNGPAAVDDWIESVIQSSDHNQTSTN